MFSAVEISVSDNAGRIFWILTTSVQHKRKGMHKIKIFIDGIYMQ
jgi:hypothetical protein